MKKIFLLSAICVLYISIGSAQPMKRREDIKLNNLLSKASSLIDTVGFPLQIGNKWYFKYLSTRSPQEIRVKEIIDSTSDGKKLILYKNYTGAVIDTEYWSYINHNFLIDGKIYFDSSRTVDTCWGNNLDGAFCYEMSRNIIFGTSHREQVNTFHQI